jgi:hypothetical protein
MAGPSRNPAARLHGVATPTPSPVDSPAGCLCCGRIPKPRPRQKACSSRCRWALWKATRQAQARAQLVRDQETRAALKAIAGIVQVTLGRLGGNR